MQIRFCLVHLIPCSVVTLGLLLSGFSLRAGPEAEAAGFPLTGTWELLEAYEIKPDGSQIYPYSQHPVGIFIVDAAGRYSLQIYRPERPKFASGDKAKGTADEYRAAMIGVSAHIGRCKVDAAHGIVIFEIEHSVFTNLEGATQRRLYQLNGDIFSYRIPTQTSGNVPVSVWRRVRKP
jgi:hypothetical protein